MGRELTKIVYKPSPESNEDYMIIVNPEEVRRVRVIGTTSPNAHARIVGPQFKRWKEGGTLHRL